MQTIKQQIKALYAQLLGQLNVATQDGQKIYQFAKTQIGIDASPSDLADDAVGCAESVTTILARLFPPFQVITGTYTLFLALKGAVEYVEVRNPLPGDIIISPTGLGGKNGIANGHTGIVSENQIIMSNNSNTGKWDTFYTIGSWKRRYQELGGYPVVYFRKIL